MDTTKNIRIILTNLFSEKAKDVCDSVIGQLSDGWGENISRYEGYWRFARVTQADDGEVIIIVSTENGESTYYGNRFHWTSNLFKPMSDFGIKQFFAKMIKKTAMMELRDGGISNGWKRHNREYKSTYLDHNQKTSIAEIYVIYEYLLGREVYGNGRFDNITLKSAIGTKRNEAATWAAKELSEKRKAIEAKWSARQDELNQAEKAEIEAIKEKYRIERNAIWKEYQTSLAEIDMN